MITAATKILREMYNVEEVKIVSLTIAILGSLTVNVAVTE